MTVLILSPDYASHYNPLSVLARAVACTGREVVVATGPALRGRVEAEGHGWRRLSLGPASNPGVVEHDDATERFLAATRRGPAATIRFQASERERDLLWEPERVATDIHRLLATVDPTDVIVDHVSFGSTLALHASGRPFVTLVPGHPSQLPVGEERYGVPPVWPGPMRPDDGDLAAIDAIAERVTAAFTERWNRALSRLAPDREPVDDALRVHGGRVLYNTIAELHRPERTELLPPDHRFVGPLVRSEALPDRYHRWLDRSDGRPQVYVALGTFLAHRVDVLTRIAAALRRLDARAAIACGPAAADALGPLPDDWFVEPILPQVGLLAGADVAIHHGGNNSVQEALAAGTRQIVLPFSTDQFATAADLEAHPWAGVLAPNDASADDLAADVERLLAAPRPPAVPTRGPGELAAAVLD